MRLLFMVLLVTWVSNCATSPPDQLGSGHKFVDCLPCSQAYLADSGPDPLRTHLVRDSDRTDISGSTSSCKGLANDFHVPALSEFHRHLDGEGSHRRLVTSLKFDNCPDAMVRFLDGYHSEVVIIEKLPNGVFADPFELQHLVERKVFLDVAVFGDTNLELPSALSNQSTVEIHVDLRQSTTRKNCNLLIELPLHARYPPLDASGYARVDIGSPDLFLRYRKEEMHSDSCLCVLQDLESAPAETATWQIPCGDAAHTGFVSSITFLSALVCSLSIVLAAIFFIPKST